MSKHITWSWRMALAKGLAAIVGIFTVATTSQTKVILTKPWSIVECTRYILTLQTINIV